MQQEVRRLIEVLIKTKPSWSLPSSDDLLRRPQSAWTKNSKITFAIGDTMPELVCKTFGCVSADKVLVDYQELHHLASGDHPDISIQVTVAWKQMWEDRLGSDGSSMNLDYRMLNFIVEHLVEEGLILYGRPTNPRIDVVVRLVIEHGERLGTNGQSAGAW